MAGKHLVQFAGINLKEGKLYKAYNTQNKKFVW